MPILQPLRVSYIELQSAGYNVESIEVIFDDHRRSIPRRGKYHFREDFSQPLAVRGETITFSVAHRGWFVLPKKAPEVIEINVHDILSKLPTQKFQTMCNRLIITLGLSSSIVSDNAGPGRDPNFLQPTAEKLLNLFPRCRILVIGQPGVGKSTLLNRVFGIEQVSAENFEPGQADIEKELISPQNDRLVLHYSDGFDPAVDANCEGVKSFIKKRKEKEHVKDQLHAVWLCFGTPIVEYGERVLYEGAETFLKQHANVLHDIPAIVVFTKYDKLLIHLAIQREMHPEVAAKVYLQRNCIQPIQDLVKDTELSFVAVSSSAGLEQSLHELIQLTHVKIAETFASQLGTPLPKSAMTASALRMRPRLKIEGSIIVGQQRYWRTLFSCVNLGGRAIVSCLAAIHTDIASVWNFNDPSQYLYSDEFREVMANIAGITNASTPAFSRLPRVTTTNFTNDSRSGVPLVTSAPTVQPYKADPVFLRSIHRRIRDVHHSFMAYIVHLVHILEILFAVMDDKNLTRDAVNLAFNIYRQSEMWRNAHLQIKGFDCRIPSRGAVLDMIASLVVMSPFDDKDISWALERIPPEAPERVEEWYTNSDDSALRERLASLANLVNDLNLQFSREGDMDTLADIINFQRAILDITPPLRRERLTSVVNLANSLDKRFKAKGGIEDLGQVIDLRRAALQLTFPGHQGRVMSLDDLANAPKERFLRDGDTDDLKEAITLRRASPLLTSPGHQGDVASLDNLANSLLERFRREADASDLEEIIILRRAALQLTPPGRQGHVVFLDNLADSLHERLRREAGASDLAEIVRLRRTALQFTPPEHPEHPVFLAKLLDCLDERFSKEGGTKDLTEIITLRLTALQFTPPGHPGRFASLVSLSNSLYERFRRGDDLADLDEVIALRRTALECTPPLPSDKYMSLLNLATCLREKYQRLFVKDDLAEAVTHARAALALCPLEHYDSCLDFLAVCVDLLTRKWRLPSLTMQAIGSGAGSSGVTQMVRSIVAETIKTLPPRLLNTITGVLCDRDAQISYFEGSVHYDELLSSLSSLSSIHDDPACKALVHSTISKFFRYGTLSHRWGTGEPLLRDIQGNNIYDLGDGEGIAKLQNFSLLTLRHRYSWAWSDTCCINKDSSSELQEAIASMFSWYHHSALTIVHLSDVSDSTSFTNSVWFRRGWTLQELLASPRILFYTQDWSLYKGCTSPNHKVDSDIFAELQEATGIGESHLKNFSPGIDDARSRLRWASARSTTRSEDSAYSLFGIFQVHLPVIYGEFAEGALGRLLVEIISRSGDVSVLDWVGEASPFHSCFPASLTSYQTLSCAQSTPSDPSKYNGVDRGEERILYNALVQLPSPRFVGRRLALPCIVHRITRVKLLATSSKTSCHDYEIAATNLVPLKLTMSSRLQEGSGSTLPYALIRPWSPKVLDLLAPGDVLGSLLEWLGQPFNALLLESSLHNDWKRIASGCLINVRVEDGAGVLDSQCQILEIV